MFTRKNPNAIDNINTMASTKKSARPETKELVRGYFFVMYVSKSDFVISSIIYQKLVIV